MAEVVNLNKFRKTQARAAARKEAEANRLRFGRTKAERAKTEAETRKATQDLAGKRLDPDRDCEN